MADGKVVISTALDNKGIDKGIKELTTNFGNFSKTAAKTAAGIAVAFAAAAVAVTKQAAGAYADYEQLAGGVETLFKGSANKVKAYAEEAYRTVGLSANEYMSTVTSFSASLISALGGDTDKAADVANMALVDMADNANKMGASMESIQNAYQGFAKQNYTMLDNLKLGYGGTKTEMQRLLKDAQSLTGVKYDINNLSDVYSAIHAIQEEMGITGTTALEAEKTISGSAAMTKAAWENVLTAIAGGGDLDKAIDNLVDSTAAYFDNIVPVVQRSISGIGELIEKVAPQLVQSIASALIQAIPGLLEAVYQMVIGLAKGIYQGVIALFTGGGITGAVEEQMDGVASSTSAAAQAQEDLAEGIEEADKAAKASLAGFDELTRLQSGATDADADSGSSASFSSGASVTIPAAVDIQEDSGLSSKIQQVFGWMQEKVKELSDGFQVAFAPSIQAWGGAWDQIKGAAEDALPYIGESLKGLWDGPLTDLTTYLAGTFVPDVANSFSEAFAPVVGGIYATEIEILSDNFVWGCDMVDQATQEVLLPSLANIKNIWQDLMSGIKKSWNQYGGKILDGAVDAFENLRNTLTLFWDEVLSPLFSNISEQAMALWDEHLKPLWDELTQAIGSLVLFLENLWNKVLAPLVNWLIETFGPVFTKIFSTISGVISTVFGVIADIVRGVIATFRTILDFLNCVFVGDWEGAWNTVKDGIKNLWEGIVDFIKKPINSVIGFINKMISGVCDGINFVIDGINNLSFDVPDWVPGIGGSTFGFDIKNITPPQIPLLAKGAVLPPNKPFLAMVGDQTHGTNVEAPLATIQEAVAIVMEDMVQSNLAGQEAIVGVLKDILEAVLGIRIGDDVIGQAVARYNAKMAVIRGGL